MEQYLSIAQLMRIIKALRSDKTIYKVLVDEKRVQLVSGKVKLTGVDEIAVEMIYTDGGRTYKVDATHDVSEDSANISFGQDGTDVPTTGDDVDLRMPLNPIPPLKVVLQFSINGTSKEIWAYARLF